MQEVSLEAAEAEDKYIVLYSEYRRQFNAIYEDLISLSEVAIAGRKNGKADGGRNEDWSAQKTGGLQRAIETVRRGVRQGAGDAGMP